MSRVYMDEVRMVSDAPTSDVDRAPSSPAKDCGSS